MITINDWLVVGSLLSFSPLPAVSCKVCLPEAGQTCERGLLAPAPGFWNSCPNSEGAIDNISSTVCFLLLHPNNLRAGAAFPNVG